MSHTLPVLGLVDAERCRRAAASLKAVGDSDTANLLLAAAARIDLLEANLREEDAKYLACYNELTRVQDLVAVEQHEANYWFAEANAEHNRVVKLDDARACEGAETRAVRTTEHGEQCRACGLSVRADLTTHPFWGFASTCPLKHRPLAQGDVDAHP